METEIDPTNYGPEFLTILESAAKLQAIVPDAVVVGGTAAALYAAHRLSSDHDHVLADLRDHFEIVLDALEADQAWATNRIIPGKVILGNLDGIEAGVRQMIRKVPLEIALIKLPSGVPLRVPSADEILRIKAFLIVRRNQTRDYLDVAALADHCGIDHAGQVLRGIDRYYSDQRGSEDGVCSQLVRQLGDPRPADFLSISELDKYKRLNKRWSEWGQVREVCGSLAAEIIAGRA